MTEEASVPLLVDNPTPGVRVLAFNRPRKRNALSQQLISVFLKELSQAASDQSVRAIVVTGSSSFFCAGADIGEIAELDAEKARASRYLENLCTGMQSVRKPLVAAVEGMALGGGFEVALMCDIIIASRNSTFGLPEVKIGLLPGAGGTQRLTSAVGKFKAMQMIMLGTPISASDAHTAGLVAQVAESGTVLVEAIRIAETLAGMSATALSLAKEAVCRADDLGRDDNYEQSLYYYAFGTQDKREGIAAFLEKRSPKWDAE